MVKIWLKLFGKVIILFPLPSSVKSLRKIARFAANIYREKDFLSVLFAAFREKIFYRLINVLYRDYFYFIRIFFKIFCVSRG